MIVLSDVLASYTIDVPSDDPVLFPEFSGVVMGVCTIGFGSKFSKIPVK